MTEPLTFQHLLECLQQKQKYKGTQIYIQEILKKNEQIYRMIDDVLLAILIDDKNKNSYFAKLYALRFFKQVFLTGNFDLIDGINEKIEEHIVEVGHYNRKIKDLNRGANYFVEVQKYKKDADVQKVSISYVLFTLEIIMMFAKWYAKDQEGNQTRFVEYFEAMRKKSITFPTESALSFFKAEDEMKFKKNYSNWMLNTQVNNTQFQQIKLELSNKKQQSKQSKAKQVPIIAKEENTSILQNQMQNQNYTLSQENNKLEDLIKEQRKISTNYQQAIQTLKIKNQQLENQLIQTTNLHDQKLSNDLKSLKTKIQENEKQSHKTTLKQMEKIQKLERKLKQKQKLIDQLHVEIKQYQKQSQAKQKLATIQLQNDKIQLKQLIQVFIHQPKQYKEIEVTYEKMKKQLDLYEEVTQQKNKLIKTNQQLLLQYNKKEKEITDLKLQLSEKMQRKIIKQEVLVPNNLVNSQFQIKQILPDQQCVNSSLKCSMSDFLAKNRPDFISQTRNDTKQNNIFIESVKNQRKSIGKTEKSLKKTIKQIKKDEFSYSKVFSNTGMKQLTKVKSEAVFMKTFTSSFSYEPKMCTTFPYLSTYFPEIGGNVQFFKESCLLKDHLSKQIFVNPKFRVELKEAQQNGLFIITIQNKTDSEQKIKVAVNHSAFILNEERLKVNKLSKVSFSLRVSAFDVNLRFPLLTVQASSSRLSLTRDSLHQEDHNNFTIALPLTLWSFCQTTSQNRKYFKTQNKMRYKSQTFSLSHRYSNMKLCFPDLLTKSTENKVILTGLMSCYCLKDIQLHLEVRECNRMVSICIQFSKSSKMNDDFAKVMLQVLMHLLK